MPKPIIDLCEKGEALTPVDRTTICNFAVQYLTDILKDTTRNKCGEIAQELCKKYPKSFRDSIGGDDEEWRDGFETLRLKIYNVCNYKKSIKRAPKRPINDSDDEELEARASEETLSRRQDEYTERSIHGCSP